MSAFKEITLAFSAKLADLTGGWEIAWPNLEYTRTPGTSFLRASFLPGDSVAAAVGESAQNRNVGIFQVDVNYAGQDGWAAAMTKADAVAAFFKRGTDLTNGGVTVRCESASIGPASNENGWYRVPVSIAYRADTNN